MKDGLHYSKDLEFAVLGACLLEKLAIGRVYGIILPNCFYYQDNQKVFTCLLEMFDENIPIDLVTVMLKMNADEVKIDEKNIAWYLTKITQHVVSSAHLEYHAYILKEMWRKRELIKITNSGVDESIDTKQQIYGLNQQLNDILSGEIKKDWYDMSELMYNLMVHQQKVQDGNVNFVTSGFKAIDNLNGGFWGGQMIVIGARPSMGKSALVGKIAMSIAAQKKTVGIISLEMDNNQISARLAALDTDIPFQTIYRNLFEDERQKNNFHHIVSNQTVNIPIHVSDKTRVDINEIKAKAAKLKRSKDCACLIIDYLQLVESYSTNKNYNREQEVSKISRGVKLMAVEMDIPIILVCQVNRESAKRGAKDRYPKESELRESGSIEQDADAIIMLHRDWKAGFETDENGNTTEYEADLLGLKWRNGSMFHLKIDFEPRTMKFKERTQINASKWRPVKDFTEPEKDENTF